MVRAIDCELIADLIYKTSKKGFPSVDGALKYLSVNIAIELEEQKKYSRSRYIRLCGQTDYIEDEI